MRALITGGCGFIGSHVVEAAAKEDWEIMIIDNLSTGDKANVKDIKGVEIIQKNISDAGKDIAAFKPDYIFHLAALPRIQPSFIDPIGHDVANVHETIRLIGHIDELSVTAFIYSSSSSCYGEPKETPTREGHPIEPISPYAIQKYSAERYVHVMCKHKSIKCTALRYFNVYGPRSFNMKNKENAYSSVVGIFKNAKDNGERVRITGDGEQRRDFIHVSDVAHANVFAAKNIALFNGRSLNVGSGLTISINELSRMMDLEVDYISKREGEAHITHADITEIRALGWEPRVRLEEAILNDLI